MLNLLVQSLSRYCKSFLSCVIPIYILLKVITLQKNSRDQKKPPGDAVLPTDATRRTIRCSAIPFLTSRSKTYDKPDKKQKERPRVRKIFRYSGIRPSYRMPSPVWPPLPDPASCSRQLYNRPGCCLHCIVDIGYSTAYRHVYRCLHECDFVELEFW